MSERLINAVESIAESLKIIAEKPPVGFTLEMTDGFNKASENLRDLVLADTRYKKEKHPLCEEHSGAGL